MIKNDMKKIDLRSDTVTQPTTEMRAAMCNAVVGDDVLGEDPTVKRLEAMAADMLGKEAGLFLTSGTMANQVAVLTLTRPGDQILVHDRSHIYNLEVDGLRTTCGVQPRVFQVRNGIYPVDELVHQINTTSIQQVPTTLLCLENSHDLNQGLAIPSDQIDEVCQAVKDLNLAVYLDGARLFNAAIALNVEPSTLTHSADMIAFCLSKGLACPVGSVLVGSRKQIELARRMRQRLGGGWRQAGILAAAGIYALENLIDRLAEDHENARELAMYLKNLGFGIDETQIQTNIILVNISHLTINAYDLSERMKAKGVLIRPIDQNTFRLVTHIDINPSDIATIVDAFTMDLEKKRRSVTH
jgi:threonine aldolase